jgi:hypothetical protein
VDAIVGGAGHVVGNIRPFDGGQVDGGAATVAAHGDVVPKYGEKQQPAGGLDTR